jgi:hypothetical protein
MTIKKSACSSSSEKLSMNSKALGVKQLNSSIQNILKGQFKI